MGAECRCAGSPAAYTHSEPLSPLNLSVQRCSGGSNLLVWAFRLSGFRTSRIACNPPPHPHQAVPGAGVRCALRN